jgi:glycerophosphoryl diester phosphodiesterase
MSLFDRLESLLLPLADRVCARVPQPQPAAGRLQACKVISHRGEHDNREVFENTVAAFDAALAAGVWGIELDLRWTKDLCPVVVHDPDLSRVFGLPLAVAETTAGELARRCPQVPTLAEVIARFGGRVHLMVEIKAAALNAPERQDRALSELFSALQPGGDYHFLSLEPAAFRRVRFAPRHAFVPVARLNFQGFSRLALREGYGGVAGHYALVGAAAIARHRRAGQCVGTGYPRSANCLFRELNRGVEWIFSNHAGQVQALIRRLHSPES